MSMSGNEKKVYQKMVRRIRQILNSYHNGKERYRLGKSFRGIRNTWNIPICSPLSTEVVGYVKFSTYHEGHIMKLPSDPELSRKIRKDRRLLLD